MSAAGPRAAGGPAGQYPKSPASLPGREVLIGAVPRLSRFPVIARRDVRINNAGVARFSLTAGVTDEDFDFPFVVLL
jgi:hypothetical protein